MECTAGEKGSKHNVLTHREQQGYSFNRSILRRIDEYCDRCNLGRSDIRILDYGCGRGRAVLWLRTHGYQAWGVDIDPQTIEKGRPLAQELGYEADGILRPLASDGSVPFGDESFDFTVSDQVFEHVADIDSVARELARVTRKGGEGVHIYPGDHYLREGHLFMPCVHWLPKNRSRAMAIYLYTLLGIEPRWPQLDSLPSVEKARTYYRYSIEKTFYRNPRLVRKAFHEVGLGCRFDTINSRSMSNHPLAGKLARLPLAKQSLGYLLSRLVSVELVIHK